MKRTFWLAAGALVFTVAIVHAPSLYFAKFANVDEAYAGSIAQRLLAGEELYQGAVSQRGPLFYYFYAALSFVAGWNNVRAVRFASLAITLVTIGLTYRLHREVGGSRPSALVSASILAFGFALGLPPIDGLALNAELVLAPLVVLAVGVSARVLDAPPRHALALLAGSGLLIGAATSIKQVAFVHGALLVVLACVVSQRRLMDRVLAVAVAAVSVATLPGIFALRAWHKGSLHDLVYYTWTYNKVVHLGFSDQRDPGRFLLTALDHPVAVVAIALAIGAWLSTRKEQAHSEALFGLKLTAMDWVAVNFVCALAIALRAPQAFPHYLVPALPLFAVLCGDMFGRVIAAQKVTPALVIANVVVATLATVQAGRVRSKQGRVAHDIETERVASTLATITRPSDSVFVWGFSPWLYGYSGRPNATRFSFVTYPTGFVPWFWDELDAESSRVVPGSMEALVSDIDRARPKVIVDAGSVSLARPMRAYPAMQELVTRDYCFAARVGHYDFYERHPKGESCALGCFPLPPAQIDHQGKAMNVRAPAVIDARRSPALSSDGKEPIVMPSCGSGS